MARDDSFFSPVVREGGDEACGRCNACGQACRARALVVSDDGTTVDRAACGAASRKAGEDCFDCLLACRKGVLTLRKFTYTEDGTIEECP